jgi:toxin ParE1/3/4
LSIRLSKEARQDLDDIWLYVAQDNIRAADRLIDRLVAAGRRLEEFPAMGIARDDLHPGLRALRVDNYIIFYAARSGGPRIERILHTRLDITSSRF